MVMYVRSLRNRENNVTVNSLTQDSLLESILIT